MAETRYPAVRGMPELSGFFRSWDEFIRRFMSPSFFERTLTMGSIAPVDVCERNNEFVIRMACPGCRPQDIDVTVENDVVRIRGKFMGHEEMEQASQTAGHHESCLIRELPTGRFERDIALPTAVNAQQARATFENGLLTIVLPKAQAAQGHRIQIATGQTTGAAT
ncbi:MAG: Hsp20/alpha crystallin family protein [Chloroflexi bacterium]|nr:Hsp20/alpha crystallin family protein [Chloroflexota bacterium]